MRLIVLLATVSAGLATADDVGITSARLLELDDGSYAVEADIPPRLVGALRPPVVPKRFTVVSKPTYRRLGVSLVVRYEFGGADQPLHADDSLLLPWLRSAVLLTAQWSDGVVQRGMFPATLAGIKIPIEVLRPVEHRPVDVARRHLATELGRVVPMPLRVLVLVGVVLSAPARRRISLMVFFAAGHFLAMPALELGAPAIPSPLAGALLALGAALLARAAIRDDDHLRGGWLLGALGLIDGLGIACRLTAGGVAPGEIVPALFGSVLGVDLALMILVVALSATVRLERQRPRTSAAVVVGAIAAAAVIASVATFGSPETAGIDPADRMAAARFDLQSGAGPGAGGARTAAPPRRLDDPAMIFLTVEPLEVRVEALLSLRDFLEPLRIAGGPGSVVPVEVQDAIAERALRMVRDTLTTTIDGREAVALLERTDFVTVAATGVTTRTEPVPEPLATSVLGVTLAYGTDRPPAEIELQWRVFPSAFAHIPATWSDPTGSQRQDLTPKEPRLEWSNRIASFQPPPVSAVEVAPRRLPLFSLGLAVLATVLWWRSRHTPRLRPIALIGLAAAVVLYPFARTALALPGVAGWAPSNADAVVIADELLTNVYRAFDFRDEETIYDRLAVTVIGDKLSQIYLENRRALELENRGGARAKVDEVEVLEIRDVSRDGDGGFRVEAVWEVSGSVNHFGHVHYRQNRYDAALTIIAVDGAWKISDIEILDERRVL